MPQINAGLDVTKGSHLKNIIIISLPIMISNFMQTLYNLTDTFWLGQMGGEEAKIGVSIAGIAFPIVFFINSFSMGLVVAATALISRYRGANEPNKIKELVSQFSMVFALIGLLFVGLAFIFMEDILLLLQTPPEVMSVGLPYMNVTMLSVLFSFVYFAYQGFSHGLGDTMTPMTVQLITIILNIILDPFLIFGWWIFPKVGILGAAYATFFCRFLTAIMSIFAFFGKTKQFIPSLRHLKPDFKIIKTILKISIPASISHSTLSIGFLALQGLVNSFGTVIISVRAIGNRLTSIFTLPAMGLSQGLSAVVGQNLGANNIPRITKTIRHSLIIVTSLMIVGGLVMFFFGAQLTHLFIDDPEVIRISIRMFRVTAFNGLFFGTMFLFVGIFNGAGRTVDSMKLNIARLWIFEVPIAYLLSGKIADVLTIGFFQNILSKLAMPMGKHPYDSLWWAMLFANALTTVVGLFIYRQGKWKTVKISH